MQCSGHLARTCLRWGETRLLLTNITCFEDHLALEYYTTLQNARAVFSISLLLRLHLHPYTWCSINIYGTVNSYTDVVHRVAGVQPCAVRPYCLHGQLPAMATDYAEAQTNELLALQSIFDQDFEQVETKSAWSKTTDQQFKIKIRASSDRTNFVVLVARLTATYPKSPPVLEVTGLEDYHERTQRRIRNIIRKSPKQLVGDVMIHTIVIEIEDALEDAVQARQQGTLPSLEDERAGAEEEAAARAREVEDADARRQQMEKAEETKVLQQMVDLEVSRREKQRSSKNVAASVPNLASDEDLTVSFDQPTTIIQDGESFLINSVSLIKRSSHHKNDETFMGRSEVTTGRWPPLVSVRRITVRNGRNAIMEIEHILEQACKLRHASILCIWAFRVDRVDTQMSRLVVCSEHADLGTLQTYLEAVQFTAQKARQFTVDLLEGIDYLHRHGLVHGSLSCAAIIVSHQPSLAPKLTNFGYDWLLDQDRETLYAGWQAPEGKVSTSAAMRKSDIWNLGTIIMQLFLGLHVTMDYASPLTMMSRLDFSYAFNDFASKVFTTDPKKRPTAFDLLPTEFLRTNAAVMDEESFAAPSRRLSRPTSGAISPVARRSRHDSSGIVDSVSRYATDFTEINRLGKGGFGEVVRARNKLDGGVFAVKKIKQAPQLLDKVLSEVMLLHRLNHPYVVRYFSTWVENDISGPLDESVLSTDETTTRSLEDSDESSAGFGYQSTGGLDFVSSTGPHIEFGENESEDGFSENGSTGENDNIQFVDDGESALESAETSEAGPLRPRVPRNDSRQQPSILYIQMEYCERHTLRDLIRKGMSNDDSWRYARQITEGLSHIHGHGIIHRDLKPDNIFIDMAGNPKIGDFGLATTSSYYPSERIATMSGQSGGDMTRSVGTALYVAPELKSTSGSSYNEKVDMYSLGIMFFEMCELFGTAMERIKALQHIRPKDHELPKAYVANGEKSAQGRLINCLISHKPSERPSSTELLRSDIIPVKIEDETIRQLLHGLSDTRSPYYQKMMSALFAHDRANEGRVKALAWDAKASSAPLSKDRMRLRSIARQTLERVFRRHGAEETKRENLFPKSEYYTNPHVVQMLDASGNLVQLPYDLILPHARQLSRQMPEVKRTFVFGSAYRDALDGGPPKVSEEVDFDIVNRGFDEAEAQDDAEVLKVIDEIMEEITCFRTATVSFHVNHSAILDSILEYCRIATPQHPTVKEMISRLGYQGWTWNKIRAELRKFGLPDTTLDDIQQYDFRDTPAKAFTRLRALLGAANTRLRTKLNTGIDTLEGVLQAASQLTVQRNIYISPLGSVHARFYEGGILFQCVLERKSSRNVLAAGGRYDGLIQAHRSMDGRAACRGAVGVSIGLDPIIAHMAKQDAERTKSTFLKDPRPMEPRPKRCDVLVVTSPSRGAQRVGTRILTTLWSDNISAELATDPRSLSDETDYNFVVTIRHEASSTVRVKTIAAAPNSSTSGPEPDETDVAIPSLLTHLHQEFREREPSKPRPPAFTRQPSHPEPERRSAHVHVLSAPHRSKKSNKFHIADAAQTGWRDKLAVWRDKAPILAIDTRDELLDALRDTRLADPDSWRRALHSVELTDRVYLQQIQDVLQAWRRRWMDADGMRDACVFNFRTSNCVYYDLGL
nr:eif-2-alpha kinase gcn2 [Quercus suber]